MRFNKGEMAVRRHRFAVVLALAFTVASLIGSTFVSAARTQDSRPRRSTTLAPQQRTPAPPPSPTTRTVQNPQTPRRPATPTPTPTPVPRSTPSGQIAPILGEPPPPPILKPKPTPTPPEEVIAKIEALNPPWKKDLLPWQVAQPGEKIPWQAVYGLIKQPVTPEAMEWARRKLVELGLAEDA